MKATRTPDLRLLRHTLGFTQQQMAFALGASSDSIFRWEKGYPISIMGRRLIETFVSQPRVLRLLLAKLTPQQLARALGYPDPQPREAPSPGERSLS